MGLAALLNERSFCIDERNFHSSPALCSNGTTDIWYVAFEPKKPLKPDDSGARAARSTRTFKSEIDAKLFAMQILAKGWSASAGTLNPHQPKQIVAPSEIDRWVEPRLGN